MDAAVDVVADVADVAADVVPSATGANITIGEDGPPKSTFKSSQ